MTKEFNEKRFLAVTRVMSILTKIVMILLGVVFVLLTIIFLASFFVTKETLTFDLGLITHLNYSFLNVNLRMPVDLFEGEYMIKGVLQVIILSVLVAIGFITYFLILLQGVLQDVAKKLPFSEENVKKLYHMSYTFMWMAVIVPIFVFISGKQVIDVFKLQATVSYSIQTNTLFIGVLIWILASIFNYGKYLQDEVDQTV